MKKLKVTKEFLKSIGITRCDENGQLYRGDYPVSYSKI